MKATMTSPGQSTTIYARINLDMTGQAAGVERQEQACRELAERRGWVVAEVFVDNSVSATSDPERPAYRRMVEAVETGSIDAILAVDLDRLTRTPRRVEDLIDLATERSVAVLTASGDLDLNTPTGRFHARTLANVARMEVAHAGERRRRANRQRAMTGLPTMTGTRPFGWAENRIDLDPDEAAHLREAVDIALGRGTGAGGEDGLTALVSRWNHEGVTTSRGNSWTVANLRKVLESPRLAGLVQRTATS